MEITDTDEKQFFEYAVPDYDGGYVVHYKDDSDDVSKCRPLTFEIGRVKAALSDEDDGLADECAETVKEFVRLYNYDNDADEDAADWTFEGFDCEKDFFALYGAQGEEDYKCVIGDEEITTTTEPCSMSTRLTTSKRAAARQEAHGKKAKAERVIASAMISHADFSYDDSWYEEVLYENGAEARRYAFRHTILYTA